MKIKLLRTIYKQEPSEIEALWIKNHAAMLVLVMFLHTQLSNGIRASTKLFFFFSHANVLPAIGKEVPCTVADVKILLIDKLKLIFHVVASLQCLHLHILRNSVKCIEPKHKWEYLIVVEAFELMCSVLGAQVKLLPSREYKITAPNACIDHNGNRKHAAINCSTLWHTKACDSS